MKTPSTSEKPVSREEVIRERAYELYEKRGKQDGADLDDWLTAEIEVLESEPKEDVRTYKLTAEGIAPLPRRARSRLARQAS